VHHHREGSGPPLVLVHGVGHHWQGWRPVIDLLRDDFDVLAVDSPGFGRCEPLPDGVRPTVWAHADAFEAFFREQGLDRPHVAGNSMGGAIGLELARRGAARSVTAFSPAGFWTPGELRYAQLSLGLLAGMPRPLRPGVVRLARTRWGRAVLYAQLVAKPGRMPAEEAAGTLSDAFASPAMAATLRAFDDYEFTAGNELDDARVTVAWGEKDYLLPYRRQAPRARAALPRARHVSLPGVGHVPYSDDPAAVAEVIRTTALGAERGRP
jgi:pimeloyl-ACP methyl ester carboxylesterase